MGRAGLSGSGQMAIAGSPLLTGLGVPELAAVMERMRPCHFDAGQQLCAAGDPSDTVWVITGGLVHWLAPTTEGGGEVMFRMRKGEPIGAMDAVTGMPRSATVVASMATSALAIDRETFVDLARRYPQILINIVSTQRERLLRANARRLAEQARGEEIALAPGPSLKVALSRLVTAARQACPRPVTFTDRALSFAGTLAAAEDLAGSNATVVIPAELEAGTISVLLDEVDRVVALAGTAEEAEQVGRLGTAVPGRRLEAILVGDDAVEASRSWPAESNVAVVRTFRREEGFPLADGDLAWIARHLTRTKLGVALGAGGSKGYAHVGVLQVLEEAGYVVDYAGGSSIGGFVASQLALGRDAATIDARFRAAFDEDNVNALFATPFGGGSAGIDVLTRLLQEATDGRSFDDTVIPLVIMAADLSARAPAPQRDGPLWDALLAALAVAGVFPPRERDGSRLIDALALVPVPTAAVVEDGADIVVSVNLMSTDVLDRWPEGPEIEPPARKARRGPLDTILEAMDLSQLDTSTRHAALADVTVTPQFAAADWRDFHLADLFLAAGRAAALEQLPSLEALALPVDPDAVRRESPVV